MKTAMAADQAAGDGTPEAGLPDSASVIASDEFAGLAGSFVFDPATGKRTPVAGPACDAARAAAGQSDSQPKE